MLIMHDAFYDALKTRRVQYSQQKVTSVTFEFVSKESAVLTLYAGTPFTSASTIRRTLAFLSLDIIAADKSCRCAFIMAVVETKRKFSLALDLTPVFYNRCCQSVN